MSQIDDLFAANEAYATGGHTSLDSSRPRRRLAVVTCMDVRIDPLAALGLQLGEAHIIRNAGGRVTDDVLRSLAVSSHALGVDTVLVMQHTGCGMAGVTDEELRHQTGADLVFHTIGDHATTIRADVELLASTAYLRPVTAIAGALFDVETGRVTDVVRWSRS